MNPRNRSWILSFALVLAAVAAAAVAFAAEDSTADWLEGDFAGTRAEVEELMAYYEAIQLTEEQESLRVEALQPLPAACCNQFSAATCCCECNLSRALWGLSKFLIVEKEASAEQVRESAKAFYASVNDDAFPGNTCMTGKCGLPFKEGGCGGMNKNHLIH